MYVFVLTSCTNYFSFFNTRTDRSLKCACQYYQIDFLLYFIFPSFFSLYGTVVSALRAWLHPPRPL